MKFSKIFAAATREYNDFEKFVPAPYMRKNFDCIGKAVSKAEITVCSSGFYRVFINGKEFTKGALAPYITNPDSILFYDNYDLTEDISEGKNVVSFILGNGMMNAPGGSVWEFEKAPWRGAPAVAFSLEITYSDGTTSEINADSDIKVHPSPIHMDDLRMGEFYDARAEIDGWNLPGFCDDDWDNAILVTPPRGEMRLTQAEPIKTYRVVEPVSIRKGKLNIDFTARDRTAPKVIVPEDELPSEGWIYDFGINSAGIPKLRIKGEAGQKVVLQMCEHMEKDGSLCLYNISFQPYGLYQRMVYILKGGEEEIHLPSFTYYGFRYCFVSGITEEQATPSLLEYHLMSSNVSRISDFSCSDETANKLFEMTLNSDLSNFYYFLTDCPHREKNGWTGDAALSSEQVLMHFTADNSFCDWIRLVGKAMRDDGALPGIVPTGTWGFSWGNGPAWDAALTYLPYYMIKYRNDTSCAKAASAYIMRYLNYLWSKRKPNGLLEFGLGDWCPSGHINGFMPSPLVFTDSVISMDIADKAACIFDKLGMAPQKAFALELASSIRASIRKHLIDFGTMSAAGNCQTSQAMAIFYDVFEPGEKPAAFARLKEYIAQKDDHMAVGILGARVIFRVLGDFGEADLAYKMITRPDFPSYGNWIKRGATSLWEDFRREFTNEEKGETSKNHHFFGDISAWFISYICGIRVNPNMDTTDNVDIMPCFIESIDNAHGEHVLPRGKLSVSWERQGEKIVMTVVKPGNVYGYIRLPVGYKFDDTTAFRSLASGTYTIVKYDCHLPYEDLSE
ncbi:MAG: hypothetical protein E7665_04360 [Ruminococcaceae bacterium]|nr:hypothetical protein [Oscillospiraceae bacterium]